MPVSLNVSQIRRYIYRKTAELKKSPEVGPSSPVLGRIFHESFAALFSPDHQNPRQAVLDNAEHDKIAWQAALLEHAYERFIGPRLARERSHLTENTPALLDFWEAVKAMNRWIVDILWTATPIHPVFNPEEPLSMVVHQDGWSDSVLVTGSADLVLRIPGRDCWCLVELKLGRGCPEADLAQLSLYHQMLSSGEETEPGAAALISFRPRIEERLFEVHKLQKAGKALQSLIGKLAGVAPWKNPANTPEGAATQPPAPEPKTGAPTEGPAEELASIFREYGIEIRLQGAPIAGPTFIRHPISLGKGVKLNAARKTALEIQHRLHLDAPPLIHLSEGDVVVDIQRPDRRVVPFEDIRPQLPAPDPVKGCSLIPLGVDLNNTLRCADLAEPENVHILVAGTTGSGKSEWLRTALAGAVLTNVPETLRLVLIDPKRNAFNELRGSPFLLAPEALVYPDEQPAGEVLARIAGEMEDRYRRLQQAGADHRDEYVIRTRKPMPRILCVCDEYFDLISRGKEERRELETHIFRLGAKARAAGIHLIIATQHPNRTTIKGALDANIPARVALKMNKPIESNMLLNQKGAENLLGAGDLLFRNIGDPLRLQAPFLPPEERKILFST